MRGSNFAIALLLAVSSVISGCSVEKTGDTEYSLMASTNPFWKSGPRMNEIIEPGRTVFKPPWYKFYAFDTKIMKVHYVFAPNAQGNPTPASTSINTRAADGNEVFFELTVMYHIDASDIPKLWDMLMNVAQDNEDVAMKLEIIAEAKIRDTLGVLETNELYDAELRSRQVELARTRLNEFLAEDTPIVVDKIIYNNHHFEPDYQDKIDEAKSTKEQALRQEKMVEAVRSEKKADFETARGKAENKIEQAKGEAAQAKIRGDNYFLQSQAKASAVEARFENEAKALNEEIKALQGEGGWALVMMDLVEKMEGKFIVVPGGDGAGTGDINLQKLDLNELIKRLSVQSGAVGTAIEEEKE